MSKTLRLEVNNKTLMALNQLHLLQYLLQDLLKPTFPMILAIFLPVSRQTIFSGYPSI